MIDNKTARGVSAGALAALLTACGHAPIAAPAFEAMEEKRAGLPQDWTLAPMTGDTAAVIGDYSVFGDAQLNAYIQEALENNRTLRAQIELVNQSQAALRQIRSGLWPSLRAGLGAQTGSRVNDLNFDNEAYSFNIAGAYNVDIMGDLSASIRASVAGLRSTEATYELARRNTAAQVARLYFAVIEQRQQLALDEASLTRQRDTFRITQTRFDAGSVARDELVLGEAGLASAENDILASQASLRAAVRALEVALGRFPRGDLQVAGTLPEPPPLPALGLPELTIRSRPDVVAAELNIIQTFGNTQVARLSRWPQLDANLGLSLQNATQNTTDDLFDLDGLAFSIGASLAQTIFDGGAIDARIDGAEAGQRRALELYGQTIIDAYNGVVGAIDQFNTLESRATALQTSERANLEVLRLGELRYNEGSESLLNLFTVRDRAELAQSVVLANRRARLDQWIAVHTALGGDPTRVTPVPTTTSTTAQGRY